MTFAGPTFAPKLTADALVASENVGDGGPWGMLRLLDPNESPPRESVRARCIGTVMSTG